MNAQFSSPQVSWSDLIEQEDDDFYDLILDSFDGSLSCEKMIASGFHHVDHGQDLGIMGSSFDGIHGVGGQTIWCLVIVWGMLILLQLQ